MMKYLAAAVVLASGPAFAQSAPAHDHGAHAGHADHAAHAGHADHAAHGAAHAALTLDSSIEALMAHPRGKVALEAAIPGVGAHPAYEQFKSMSLKDVQPYSNGLVTDEVLAKVAAALAATEG
jgi:hypothetical protein